MKQRAVIILCDTNVIFGLFQRHIRGEGISHSALIHLAKKHDVYISKFIISEIVTVFGRDLGINVSRTQIESFLDISGLKYHQSKDQVAPNIIKYVRDTLDAPILQDAIAIHADYLLTRNISDFDIGSIKIVFGITVVESLPPELLE